MRMPETESRILLTNSYTEARHTAYADVESAEAIAIGARQFSPARITAHYLWHTQLGEGWTVSNIEISGPWLDDRVGTGSGRVILGLYNAPEWACRFAEANIPTVALVIQ